MDISWVAVVRPTDPHVHGHSGQRVDRRERSTAKSVSGHLSGNIAQRERKYINNLKLLSRGHYYSSHGKIGQERWQLIYKVT